jgi:hypothetical protein
MVMTEHDMLLLAAGGTLGSYLTLLAWMAMSFVSERRADRRRQLGLRGKAKLPALPAEPHPAELLEASVRDFELKLYDAVDRVEDAARRDGLL